MSDSVLKQVTNLKNLTYEELKSLYITLHGSEPPAYNKEFIIKRLAYRLQEIAYGGLSERVQKRLDDVLVERGYDENAMPIGNGSGRRKLPKSHPIIGCVFIREWKGQRYQVTAVADGFEFEGRKYRSLTAIAKVITGTHWNGRTFFGLDKWRNDR